MPQRKIIRIRDYVNQIPSSADVASSAAIDARMSVGY